MPETITAPHELDPVANPDGIVCLADVDEYPVCPYPIYCSEDIWMDCVYWDHRRDVEKIQQDRKDSLLSSLVAGINKAMATSKGDCPRITFKHFYRQTHRARKNTQAVLEAHTCAYPHTNRPFVMVCSQGWFDGSRH